MRRKKKKISFIIITCLFLITITLTIGYSLFNTNLSINTKGNLKDYIKGFDYTGAIQEFTIPYSGKYKLETWGASGGYAYDKTRSTGQGGTGGYSTGEYYLNKNDKLYLAIGGEGESNKELTNAEGGWNGGSVSTPWLKYLNEPKDLGERGLYTGGGGGATSIQDLLIDDGALKNYENNRDDILIVSGGGGGGDWYDWQHNYSYGVAGYSTGGNGGGISGSKGETGDTLISDDGTTPHDTIFNDPGTQDSGFAFGTAGNLSPYPNGKNWDSTGGSGGGYYGGTSIKTHATGAGGSGYIGNTQLTDKHMACYNCETSDEESTKTISVTCSSVTPTKDCAKIGNGYARITYLGNK